MLVASDAVMVPRSQTSPVNLPVSPRTKTPSAARATSTIHSLTPWHGPTESGARPSVPLRCFWHVRVPDRDRPLRPHRGRGEPVLGCADPTLAPSLLDRLARRRPDAPRGDPRDGDPQAGCRAGQHGARPPRPGPRRTHRGGGGRG